MTTIVHKTKNNYIHTTNSKTLIKETNKKFNKFFEDHFIDLFKIATKKMNKAEVFSKQYNAMYFLKRHPEDELKIWDSFSGLAFGKTGVKYSKPKGSIMKSIQRIENTLKIFNPPGIENILNPYFQKVCNDVLGMGINND